MGVTTCCSHIDTHAAVSCYIWSTQTYMLQCDVIFEVLKHTYAVALWANITRFCSTTFNVVLRFEVQHVCIYECITFLQDTAACVLLWCSIWCHQWRSLERDYICACMLTKAILFDFALYSSMDKTCCDHGLDIHRYVISWSLTGPFFWHRS